MAKRKGKMETVSDFIFLGSKITADGDGSHEIKRRLLPGRKAMTNLDSILKSRDITLLTKVCIGFSSSYIWMWVRPLRRLSVKKLILSSFGVGEDSWESLEQQGDQTSESKRKSILNIHWKDWCRSSNTLAIWGEELTHWKRPWCWERLMVREVGDIGWGAWRASMTQRTWVEAKSGIWWRTGKPGVLQSMGLQRVGHDWETEQTKKQTWMSNSGLKSEYEFPRQEQYLFFFKKRQRCNERQPKLHCK